MPVRLLIVGDAATARERVYDALHRQGLEVAVTTVATRRELEVALSSGGCDFVLAGDESGAGGAMPAEPPQTLRLAAVGRLAIETAHDFNNLLTAILGFSDLVLEDLAEDDPVRADVREIREAGLRAVALTRKLIAFSRQQDVDAAAVAPGSGHETVLLVEDEGAVRELASRVLQQCGYRVLAAASGEEAMRMAAQVPLDLLITDVLMPGITGPALADRLLCAQPRLRLLFISGLRDDLASHLGRHVTAPVLHKPFTPQTLRARVRDVLATARSRT